MLASARSCLLATLILVQHDGAQAWPPNKLEKLKLGYPADSLRNFTELATQYGYVSEEHVVTTEDGYVLTAFRLTKGRHCTAPLRKTPVLLMHGLFMSSDCWLDAGPNAGLGYLLSDLCYDLWVPNTRGNHYSKRHIKLDPVKDSEFWDFSQIEFGYYDLPAFIDHILRVTRANKISYVGHSQGGGALVIMNSERPEYGAKIGVNILMAPATKLTNSRSLAFRFFANIYPFFWRVMNQLGIFEVMPMGGLLQETTAFLCKDAFVADTLCRSLLAVIEASHPNSIETDTLRVLAGHFPAGTSAKNMANYGQAVNTDGFVKFDYGSVENLHLYGAVQPPAYNVSAVRAPSVVILGRNDHLTATADGEWLAARLPNLLELVYVARPLWNHFDFTYSKLNSKLVLPKIREYLERYNE